MMWHRRPVLEFPNRECLQRLLDIQSAEVIINRDLVNQAADDAQ
jgi:hypothetical protein